MPKFKTLLKFFLLSTIYYLLSTILTGCATVPRGERLATYSLNGATYVSLDALCQNKGIKIDYDNFTRVAVLSKDTHKINLIVGETLVLIDGAVEHLKHRVDFYQGLIVVPYKFKEDTVDVLFKEKGLAVKSLNLALKGKKIVVDAGHGGQDPGTIGKSGMEEKEVNLDIARRLEKLLKEQSAQVTMTRSSDNFISLERRVMIASRANADFFISVHSNANKVKSLNGFEVYYTSIEVSDSRRAKSSALHAVLNLEASSYEHLTPNLKATLWDMIYTSSRAESVVLANSICQTVNQDMEAKILGVKGAGFYVLKGASMPAVLIEVGFLSNKNEERLLCSDYYRQQIAQSIAKGIEKYISNNYFAEVRE